MPSGRRAGDLPSDAPPPSLTVPMMSGKAAHPAGVAGALGKDCRSVGRIPNPEFPFSPSRFRIVFVFSDFRFVSRLRSSHSAWPLTCIVSAGNRRRRIHDANCAHFECFSAKRPCCACVDDWSLGRAAAFAVCRPVSDQCEHSKPQVQFAGGGKTARFRTSAG